VTSSCEWGEISRRRDDRASGLDELWELVVYPHHQTTILVHVGTGTSETLRLMAYVLETLGEFGAAVQSVGARLAYGIEQGKRRRPTLVSGAVIDQLAQNNVEKHLQVGGVEQASCFLVGKQAEYEARNRVR